jgi:uncharacterized protein (DUF1697 family)
VSTYIQSGNVVFQSPTVPSPGAIETAIGERFGLDIAVVIRSHRELTACVTANPFTGVDLKRLYVVFLAARPDVAAVDRLDPDRSPPDELAVTGSDVYLHLPNGAGRTKLTLDWLERKLATTGTARNWNTVNALVDLTSPTRAHTSRSASSRNSSGTRSSPDSATDV